MTPKKTIAKFGVTGHQDISPDIEIYVKQQLQKLLSPVSHLEGISSLAVGADQLFADAVLEHGGKLTVIVPAEDYRATFDKQRDLERYDALLSKADKVIELPCLHSSEEAYWNAGKAIVDYCDTIVAVWDGQPARGKGGTADIVDFAHVQHRNVVIVWPEGRTR